VKKNAKQFLSPRGLLVSILTFAGVSRLWRLAFPNEYYFDEVYHVVTAKLMAHNDPRAYEWWHPAPEPKTAIDWLHPPLAKLFQALSMLLVGDSSFGWRLSSALFGVGVIALIYFLARKLKFSQKVSLLAAALASFDGLLLTMSRITMNDIHVTFFIVLALWLYLHWREQPTFKRALWIGLAAGAAVASKWSGVFVLAPILFDQLWQVLQIKIKRKSLPLSSRLVLLASLILLIPTVYLASYGQMFIQGHGWQHLKELHQQIWWYQTNLTATHPYQSTPLQWILNLRPVYTYTDNPGEGLMRHMYIQGNPILLWGALIAVLWSLSSLLVWGGSWIQLTLDALDAKSKKAITLQKKRLAELKKETRVAGPIIFLLVAYFSMWIVWTNSPRIMFFYHYTPALPFLFILLSFWLTKLIDHSRWGKIVGYGFVIMAVLTFAIFWPNWTGLAVPNQPFSDIYFSIKSWR